ncbi:hypothetical protein AOXY_G17252 [Acipenser oxyrinchus oxyrinchus]|uniref:YqaJ viral recombinase domain-containing protein n=1 Tax=Acipenser oxyrinchus oxyrinchus TaxID=40147 RepID=A0AAD8D7B0_ACIOX|nr:hypothetical protein AOXY_G17252 [Acipenser oxyrinchus oxyrinchus]
MAHPKKGSSCAVPMQSSPKKGSPAPVTKPCSPGSLSSRVQKEPARQAPSPRTSSTEPQAAQASRTPSRSRPVPPQPGRPPVSDVKTPASGPPLGTAVQDRSRAASACQNQSSCARRAATRRYESESEGTSRYARNGTDETRRGGDGTAQSKPARTSTGQTSPQTSRARSPPVPQGAMGKIDQKLAAIEVQTRGQRENPEWFEQRRTRITASAAHKIANCRFVNGRSQEVPQSYLRSVVSSGSSVKTAAMTWGIEHELAAALRYQELKSRALGRKVLVQDCSLFIHPDKQWLAASSTGRGRCSNRETLAPWRSSALSSTGTAPSRRPVRTRPSACSEPGAYSLKRSHAYYTQVQCQLAVLGLRRADFVVYTSRDMAITPVDFDPEFWDRTEDKLEKFYTSAVQPYLARQNPALSREE